MSTVKDPTHATNAKGVNMVPRAERKGMLDPNGENNIAKPTMPQAREATDTNQTLTSAETSMGTP